MEFQTVHEMYRRFGETRADRPAYYLKKDGGGYRPVSWERFWEKISIFATGLLALGMKYRDPVTLLGLTREEWDIADKAVMCAGGISVGCYHSNTPPQVRHVVDHSESRFLLLENKEQWEKVMKIREEIPGVQRFIIMDPTGVDDPGLFTFQDMMELGRREKEKYREELENRFSRVRPDDTAILFYTSGTTGPPKGAMLTHRSILEACRANRDMNIFSSEDVSVIWLPMPHIYGRIAMIAGAYVGMQAYYAESLEKIIENIQEIQPTIFYSVPRIFEKVYSRVMGQAAEGSGVRKKIFLWARSVGFARSRALQAGGDVPALIALQYRLADRLVFRKIRKAFGGKIRVILSGGAPISSEILEFFHAADILPLELYGITETLLCTMNRPDRYRFGSVGPAGPGVEIRIAEDGEILVRSPMVFSGYLKDPEKTREALSGDGWYATGDIGILDGDGFLWITDRKKDILITAGGKNVAPQNIENLVKTSPYVSQVMVYGDRKPFLTALITLDEEEVRKWATANGIAAQDFKTLCEDPRVKALIGAVVEEKNLTLAGYERLKYFRIIPEEFTQQSGTLTATLKVRRREVIQQYGNLLEAFYGDS
jgi:long-chain acyl-CoA synthetase